MRAAIDLIGLGFIDLSEVSLQLTDSSSAFTFDDIQMARTTEFNIPATPKNNRLFELANDESRYGEVARRALPCQVICGLVTMEGYLYIMSSDKSGYKCCLLWGARTQLKALKEAGKMSEYMTMADSCRVGMNIIEANYSPLPMFGTIAYQNGYAQVPTPEDRTGYYPYHATPLPSYNMYGLAQAVATHFGMTVVAGAGVDTGIRATVPRPKKSSAALSLVLSNDSGHCLIECDEYVMGSTTFVNTASPTDPYLNVPGAVVQDNCSLTIESLTAGLCLVKYVSPTEVTMIANSAATVELKRDDMIAIVKQSELNDGMLTPQAIVDGSLTGSITRADEEALYGDLVYLRHNLPDMTAIDYLKQWAAIVGGALVVSGTEIRCLRAIAETTESEQIDLKKLIDLTEIKREALGAQHNYVRFPNFVSDYKIDNINLPEEATLMEIDYALSKSVSPLDSTGGAGAEAMVRDIRWNNEEQRAEYIAEYASLIREGENYYAEPYAAQFSPLIRRLCVSSTTVKVRAVMRMEEYLALTEDKVVHLRGQRWVWKDKQWAADVATLTLCKLNG